MSQQMHIAEQRVSSTDLNESHIAFNFVMRFESGPTSWQQLSLCEPTPVHQYQFRRRSFDRVLTVANAKRAN